MSAVDRTTIHNFGFTFIDHPLYPQDLAPWDFHPFSNLTKPLAGAHLTTTSAIMAAAEAHLNMQDKAFFQAGIVVLQRPCVELRGDYVEK